MPSELAVWRIDGELRAVAASGLDLEERLEALFDQDVTIANPGWKIIGRQVDTGLGSPVDLLAVDAFGNPAVLEPKRNQTPRAVAAQKQQAAREASSLTPPSSSAACSCRRSQGSPSATQPTGPRHSFAQKR
jgi:hypothetical protein